MAKDSIFDFRDYKHYVDQSLLRRSAVEKGQRHKLSQFIGCNPGYLSKVLNGNYDLSLEQAYATNRFLGHTEGEAKYFLNLVQWNRAGTQDLKNYFKSELDKLREEGKALKNRTPIGRTLSEEAQARYYGSWYFAVIHIAVSVGALKTSEQIARAFQLPLQTVNQTLEFLIHIGLLKKKGAEYEQGENNLFIDKDSPFISKHHTNWRMRAIQSLDQVESPDFHYSGVIACSQADVEKIREVLLKAVQEVRAIVKEAQSAEKVYCYTMDLFHLLQSR